MQAEKISKNVASALGYLEDAINQQANLSDEEVIRLAWRAASDLEYCLFLFSLAHQEDAPKSSWKLPKTKQPNINSLLTSAHHFLKEVVDSLEVDDLNEAHKKTWLVRGQLHKIHDLFWKKRGRIQKLSR
jgi:hypothetical protein